MALHNARFENENKKVNQGCSVGAMRAFGLTA